MSTGEYHFFVILGERWRVWDCRAGVGSFSYHTSKEGMRRLLPVLP